MSKTCSNIFYWFVFQGCQMKVGTGLPLSQFFIRLRLAIFRLRSFRLTPLQHPATLLVTIFTNLSKFTDDLFIFPLEKYLIPNKSRIPNVPKISKSKFYARQIYECYWMTYLLKNNEQITNIIQIACGTQIIGQYLD